MSPSSPASGSPAKSPKSPSGLTDAVNDLVDSNAFKLKHGKYPDPFSKSPTSTAFFAASKTADFALNDFATSSPKPTETATKNGLGQSSTANDDKNRDAGEFGTADDDNDSDTGSVCPGFAANYKFPYSVDAPEEDDDAAEPDPEKKKKVIKKPKTYKDPLAAKYIPRCNGLPGNAEVEKHFFTTAELGELAREHPAIYARVAEQDQLPEGPNFQNVSDLDRFSIEPAVDNPDDLSRHEFKHDVLDEEDRRQMRRDKAVLRALKDASWEEIGINKVIADGLIKQGKTKPLASQIAMAQVVLDKKISLFVTAPYACGKTEMCAILAVQAVYEAQIKAKRNAQNGAAPRRGESIKPTVMFVAPARPHAIEFESTVRKHIKLSGLTINVQGAYGGAAYVRKVNKVFPEVDILIGCPGRIADTTGLFDNNGTVKLNNLKVFILDEAQTAVGPRLTEPDKYEIYQLLLKVGQLSGCKFIVATSSITNDSRSQIMNTLAAHNPPCDILTHPYHINDALGATTHKFYDVQNHQLDPELEATGNLPTYLSRRTKVAIQAMVDCLATPNVSGAILFISGNRATCQMLENDMGTVLGQPGPRSEATASNCLVGASPLEVIEASYRDFNDFKISYLFTTPIMGTSGLNYACNPSVIIESFSATPGGSTGEFGIMYQNSTSRTGRRGNYGYAAMLFDMERDADKEAAADIVALWRDQNKQDTLPPFMVEAADKLRPPPPNPPGGGPAGDIDEDSDSDDGEPGSGQLKIEYARPLEKKKNPGDTYMFAPHLQPKKKNEEGDEEAGDGDGENESTAGAEHVDELDNFNEEDETVVDQDQGSERQESTTNEVDDSEEKEETVVDEDSEKQQESTINEVDDSEEKEETVVDDDSEKQQESTTNEVDDSEEKEETVVDDDSEKQQESTTNEVDDSEEKEETVVDDDSEKQQEFAADEAEKQDPDDDGVDGGVQIEQERVSIHRALTMQRVRRTQSFASPKIRSVFDL